VKKITITISSIDLISKVLDILEFKLNPKANFHIKVCRFKVMPVLGWEL
jgi:hypothetical protein